MTFSATSTWLRSVNSPAPGCVLRISTPCWYLAWCLAWRGAGKSLLYNPARACLRPLPPCPERAPSPGWHQVPLLRPLPSPKPELAPLSEESGDQLSQLRYHSPPGRRGPALSPTGALSASCPGGPWLHPSPSELLSLGKSESAGDPVRGVLEWAQGKGGGICPGPNLRPGFRALGDWSTTAGGPAGAPYSPTSVALKIPKTVLPSRRILFGHILWVTQASFCVLLRTEIKSDISFVYPTEFFLMHSH